MAYHSFSTLKPMTTNQSPAASLLTAIALMIASFVFLYHSAIVKLVHDWIADDNYSHAFFILPISIFFVWEKRKILANTRPQPHWFGLILIVMSIAGLLVGILGSELFTTRITILGVIAGAVLYILGWQHLKILLFPILFLLLMIPIPAIIFNQITFPLQLLASRFGELSLSMIGIPVLREGNIIQLADMSLEVVEACSGIRSLISMLTLGIVYGWFTDRRIGIRVILAIATIPIAILANGFRVAATGIAAHYYGPQVAQGELHLASGWFIFVIAFLMLFALHRFMRLFAPDSGRKAQSFV
jgi:exosortase